MGKVYNFYTLSASNEPDNVRYVGVTTKTVTQRFYGHKYCAKYSEKRGLPVHKWMFSHYEKQEEIIVKQIDSCSEEQWEDRERYWIQYYKDQGFELLNISKGGNGVITKEMRSLDSIQRSIKGHEKAIIALNLDGSFYKEYSSATQASEELNIGKSAINNVLSGRSKSSKGFSWVYKSEYDPKKNYSYNKIHKGTKVYQFDINGKLLNIYPSKKYFEKLEGWSFNGIQSAIKHKTVYHDCYWSTEDHIDINDFEPYFSYVETSPTGNTIGYYREQKEICLKYNINSGTMCNIIKYNKSLPNGNFISKL